MKFDEDSRNFTEISEALKFFIKSSNNSYKLPKFDENPRKFSKIAKTENDRKLGKIHEISRIILKLIITTFYLNFQDFSKDFHESTETL